ncbi:MAG: Mfa1 fimbrilin C-terminal domain-containing protein [Prevotella sp.]|nr:Mfa1 fimbrilin C-terminal domain-containing protein [Prevotella sp.]
MRSGTDDNANNVTYNDGLATEYTVKDATLIIFNNATNEDDATFVGAYSINTSPWASGTSHNVTEYSTKVIRLVANEVVAGYRVMVVLNKNDILEVTASDDGLKVNGTALEAGTTTYGTFRKKLTTAITSLDASPMTTTGFFMSNAPLSSSQGSTTTLVSGTTQTLVPITAGAIYKTEAAAEAGTTYDQVYVERGVAKVTMQSNSGTMTSAKVESTPLTWEVTGWMLDNTAPTTYLIRSTDNDAAFRNLHSNISGGVYRYAGNTQINDGENHPSGKYRTYFAQSVGYDTWAASGTYALNTYSSGDFSTDFGTNNPKYCFENTFDVDHQNVKNTTLVQIAITAKNGGSAVDLYTLGGHKSVVYTEDLLKAKIQEMAYAVMKGDGVTGTYGTSDITVTMPATSVAGKVEVSSTNLKVVPDVTKITSGFNETSFYTNLNAALGELTCYKNGLTYYSVRIKHFGDDLTPWNTTEFGSGTAPSSSNIYPDNSSNRNGDYLGRYGVLRNNWYDINVNSVRSLGDAEPHEGTWPDTPDDELDNYLSFRINVLSWAKHKTQDADL